MHGIFASLEHNYNLHRGRSSYPSLQLYVVVQMEEFSFMKTSLRANEAILLEGVTTSGEKRDLLPSKYRMKIVLTFNVITGEA